MVRIVTPPPTLRPNDANSAFVRSFFPSRTRARRLFMGARRTILITETVIIAETCDKTCERPPVSDVPDRTVPEKKKSQNLAFKPATRSWETFSCRGCPPLRKCCPRLASFRNLKKSRILRLITRSLAKRPVCGVQNDEHFWNLLSQDRVNGF